MSKNSVKNEYVSHNDKSKKKLSAAEKRRQTVADNLNFAATEAYKLLRTNIVLSMTDEKKCKIIGMTSSLAGEGKSTTALNLSYTLAELGKRVLLLEADMRIPVVANTLDIQPTPGLSNALTGLDNMKNAVHDSTLLDDLKVMPAGDIPPNPSELLASKKMETLLEALSEDYDYIIVDLPPVSAVSDALTITNLLSGVVIVVRQNYCDQRSLNDTMRQMKFLNVKVLGFVMVDAETSDSHYYKKKGYYKKHNYYKNNHYAYYKQAQDSQESNH